MTARRRSTHRTLDRSAAPDHARSPRAGGPAPQRASLPRYLNTAPAGPEITVQRQEAPGSASSPGYRLTPPSLLRPPDPYPWYRPDPRFQLQIDPDLELQMRARAYLLLSPGRVRADVASVAPVVPVPLPTPTPGGAGPGAGVGPRVPAPTPAPPTTQPPGTPGTESTSGPESSVREGSGGDVLSAVLGVPEVDRMLGRVQSRFTSGFSRYWTQATLGEQVGFVSVSAVVGTAALGPLLGFDRTRDFVLPKLNDVVLPVPGLSGFGMEFRFGERDVMVGAHLDVGRFLPSVFGFGPSDFQKIGGPPESGPPPLSISRTEAGDDPGSVPDGIADRVRGARPGGESVPDGLHARFASVTGEDLPPVRIHADGEADRLARVTGSVAFTSGRDIFFRAGSYEPASPSGARLLAHELSHVAQQERGDLPGFHAGAGVRMGLPGDALERSAERTADEVAGR